MPKGNKFNARKVRDDGYVFDSAAEHRRYCELRILARAKKIEDLRVHPKHELVVNGDKVCAYSPDFSYFEMGRGVVYEDVKGVVTEAAALRIRLFQALRKTEVVLIGKNVPKLKKFKLKEAA